MAISTSETAPSTTPVSASGNDTDVSTSQATGSVFDSDEFVVITGDEDGEAPSYDPPPPTLEQHQAENRANTPTEPIPPEDARELVVLESSMFAYFVQNEPAPADAGQITIPNSVSLCNISLGAAPSKRSFLGGLGEFAPALGFRAPRARRSLTCSWVTKLNFDIQFHYMKNTTDGKRPEDLAKRVDEQVSNPMTRGCSDTTPLELPQARRLTRI